VDSAARQKSPVESEARILCCRPNEGNQPRLDMGEKCILDSEGHSEEVERCQIRFPVTASRLRVQCLRFRLSMIESPQTILRQEPRDSRINGRDGRTDGMVQRNKWRTLPATAEFVTCCALLKRWISSTKRRVLFCLNALLLSASDTTFGRESMSVAAREVSSMSRSEHDQRCRTSSINVGSSVLGCGDRN
jgi:hypothetical protein